MFRSEGGDSEAIAERILMSLDARPAGVAESDGLSVEVRRMGVRVRLHKGVYYVFVNLAGRRKAHKVGPDRRTANAVAAAIRRKIARGQYVITNEHQGRTFIDLALEWLERYPLTKNLRPNTWEGYRVKVEKHLIPFFGARDVGELTPRVIEEFIVAKRAPGGSVRFPGKGLTPQYLRIVLIVLGMILQRAVRDRLIAANPVPDVNQLPRADDAAAADPFTPAELRAIVRAAGHVDRNLALQLELWARSGCRAGEVAALQEHDLDARAGTALVRRTFSRGRLGPPKVKPSNRRVFVTHPTLEDLPTWRPGSTPEARALVNSFGGARWWRSIPRRSSSPGGTASRFRRAICTGTGGASSWPPASATASPSSSATRGPRSCCLGTPRCCTSSSRGAGRTRACCSASTRSGYPRRPN